MAPDFFWMSDKHKEALALLKNGLLDNKGFTLLTGDVGIGKTTLVNAFIENLGPDTIVANISNPILQRKEFFNFLGAKFKIGDKFSGKNDFLITFRTFLEKSYRDGKQVLLIIDEAQRLDSVLLEEFRLLSNIEFQNAKLLNLFFVGQDELLETLDRYENRALRQRMSLIYHIEPLLASETGDYIHHRLRVAGTEKRIFTRKAIREIYAFSEGYPRIINTICEYAMITGYVKQKKTIDAREIIECSRELRLKKKSAPESSHSAKSQEIIWKEKTASSKKFRSLSNYLPYIAVNFFLFILVCVCFLYFPLKAGASLSDILPYWMGRIRGTDRTVTEQVMESVSPSQLPIRVQIGAQRPERAADGTEVIENTDIDAETPEGRNAK